MTTPTQRVRPGNIVSLRGLMVAAVGFAGAVHVLLAVARAGGWRDEAVALAAAGAVQLAVAVVALLRSRRAHLWAVLVATAAPAGAWLYTRTVGYPFGPFEGRTLEVHGLELLVVVAELGAAVLAGAGLLVGARLVGPDGARLATVGPALVALSLLPGLVGSEAVDNYVIENTGATHTHSHGSTTTPVASGSSTLTPVERAVLGGELERARAAGQSLPTAADAMAAGLVAPVVAAPTVGWVLHSPAAAEQTAFDVDRPSGWIYATNSPDAPVVGLMYDVVTVDPPDGFTGSDDVWHPHLRECRVAAPDGGPGFAVPQDDAVTGTNCELVDGTPADELHWMLYVWVIPGWENPWGTFAHGHPAAGVG